MTAGPAHFAVLSAIVFAIGLFGVIGHVNMLRTVVAIGVLFAAPVIALVGFAQTGFGTPEPPEGNAFAVLAVLAIIGEAAAATGAAMLVWRRSGTGDLDDSGEAEPA